MTGNWFLALFASWNKFHKHGVNFQRIFDNPLSKFISNKFFECIGYISCYLPELEYVQWVSNSPPDLKFTVQNLLIAGKFNTINWGSIKFKTWLFLIGVHSMYSWTATTSHGVTWKRITHQKKLYSPFLWMGFNCLKARITSRRQFTFYH